MDAEGKTPENLDAAVDQKSAGQNQANLSIDQTELGEDAVFAGDTLPGLSGEGPISQQDTFMRQILLPMLEEQERQAKEEKKKKAEADAANPEAAIGKNDAAQSVEETGFDGRTAFHDMAKKVWGNDDVAAYLVDELSRHAHLDRVKPVENGFELELKSGQKVKYGLFQRQDGNSFEAMVGDPKKFDDSAASAMVLLSRVHGWDSLNVHGTQDQKEKMWLAVQRQALLEYKQFTKLQAEGVIDKDAQFQPPTVANFEPDRNSRVYKQAMKELAEFEKEFGKIGTSAPAAEVPVIEKAAAETAAPVQKAETKAETRAETKTEAKAETKAEAKAEAKAEVKTEAPKKPIHVDVDLDNNRAVVHTGGAPAAPASSPVQAAAQAAGKRTAAARAPSPTDLPASIFVPEAGEKPVAAQPEANKPAGTDKSKFAAAVAAKGGHNKPGTKTAKGNTGPAPRQRKDADPGRSTLPKGSSQAKTRPQRRPTP